MMGRHLNSYRRKLLTLAVASCFAGELANANPTAPTVTRGQASFATQGNTLTVTNSPGTIINWQSFSIPSQDITRFLQQSASSAVLNRVTGATPSTILGQLQSNGRVYLINPNGITIGKGAVIDVAGFVASSLNLSDADFVAGRHRFTETPGAGAVINQGTIKTASGGMVYLVGQNIENHGIIKSPQGEIVLAAGKSVELVDAGTPEIRVQITAPDNQALNLGQLLASGGRIGMYGGLVRQGGIANANTAVVGENGKIVFKATKDVTLDAGSLTTASGPSGGSVTAQAETGTLLASGTIEAKGDIGKGGTVQLLGTQVGLTGNASVDASGQSGGGTVLVGGDFQGKNPEVQNAVRTYVGAGATIKANANMDGDGGNVIVWADNWTKYYGSIEAKGGANSGNGGQVEVSGKELLNFDGRVNVGAPAGRSGTILLDPRDITIQDTNPGPDNGQASDSSVLFADGSASTDYTISDEALEALTGNIVLQAKRDITVNSGLSGGLNLVFQGAGERVALQAGRHITISSPLTTNGAALWLEADSPHAAAPDGAGRFQINTGAPVTTNGGHITLIAGDTTNSGSQGGGFKLDADVNAGAGGIDVALSRPNTGTLDFYIGSSGQAQFTSSDVGSLKSTGLLKIGEATTAGSDGLGSGAITLKVDSIGVQTASGPVTLDSTAGTSFELISGNGGIALDRQINTNQTTILNTTGALTIAQPLSTNNNDLTISAASVSGTSLISTGTGTVTCTGTGCSGIGVITWDGGGDNVHWSDALNWSGNVVPTSANDVSIASGAGSIIVDVSATAKSLISNRSLSIAATVGSLDLTNASQVTEVFTLSGSLTGAGALAVAGPNGTLAWNGGTMSGTGLFTLSGGRSGTLSNSLALNRGFHNSGFLRLSNATVSGTGSITNAGTISAAASTTNSISVALTNTATLEALGSIIVTSFPTNVGVISVANGGSFGTGNGSLTNQAGGVIQVAAGGTFNLGTGTLSNSGAVTVDGVATAGTLTLTTGTVDGTGDLTATTDFNESGGSLGTTFTNLSLTKSGDFAVGSFQATSSVSLTATGGALLDGNGASVNVTAPNATFSAATGVNLDTAVTTLTSANSTSGSTAIRNTGALTVSPSGVSNSGGGNVLLTSAGRITLNGVVNAAGGTGEVTLAGTGFSNNAGASAISAGSGRWLVYSGDPGSVGETRGSLAFDFKRYNCTYSAGCLTLGTSVPASGKGFLYSVAPTLSVSADGVTVTYGNAPGALTYSATGFMDGDNAGSALSGVLARTTGAFSGSGSEVAGTYAIGQGTLASPLGYQITSYTAANYVIDPRALTISATGQNKVYDGGTAGTVTLADNRVSGDVLTTSYTAATFNDKNVGTAKPVSVTGLGLTGTDAGNYTFNATAATAADITPAVVSLAGNRAYDGSTSFGPSAFGTINGVNGETLTVASGAGTVASPKVLAGTQSLAAGSLALGNGTGLASNYKLAGGTHTGTITATTAVPFAWDVSSATDLRWENPANWNQGAVPLNGAMANIAGGLSGPVVYSSVSGATSLKTLSSASGFLITGGTLTLGNSPADVSTFSGRPLTVNGGTLNGTGTISLVGTTLDVLAGGVLGGSRTILGNVNNFEGTVSPGASPGIMTIDGNYYQGSLGTLLAEIGGPVAGAQYDQLIVTGTVTLGGALNVALVNGFTPATNDAFTIVQSGAISGTFASEVSAPALVTNYLASSVTLTNGAIVPDSVLNTQFNQMNNATPDSTGALNVETTINIETGEREIVDSTTAVHAKPTIKAGLCR